MGREQKAGFTWPRPCVHLYGVASLPVFLHINTYSDFEPLRMEKNSACAPTGPKYIEKW